jgi:hypothetical protein
MQVLQAQKNCGGLTATEEEVALANTDAVFEFACRFIVTRWLPGWIEEIYAEHLQSGHAVSSQPERPGDPSFASGSALSVCALQVGVPM